MRLSWLLLLPLVLVVGCKDPDDLGSDLLNPALVVTDTLDMVLSYEEGLEQETQFPLNLIAGEYLDPVFGLSTASFNTQLVLGSPGSYFPPNLRLDSVVLQLRIDAYLGNTSSPMRLQVHRLTEALSTDATYTNASTTAYDPTNLAQQGYVRFDNDPSGDTLLIRDLRIPLHASVGQLLLAADSASQLNNADFAQYFPGLRVSMNRVDDRDVGCMYYVTLTSDRSFLRMYCTEDTGAGLVQREYTYKLGNGAMGYNQFSRSQWAGTLLEQYENQTQSPYLFVQGCNLVRIKGSFDLSKLQQRGQLAINRATLLLPTDPAFSTDSLPFYFLPSSLLLYNNLIDGQLDTSIVAQSEGGAYVASRGRYELNVTRHLRDLLRNRLNFYNGFSIVPTGRNFNFTRAVLGGPANPVFRPKLILYYTPQPE